MMCVVFVWMWVTLIRNTQTSVKLYFSPHINIYIPKTLNLNSVWMLPALLVICSRPNIKTVWIVNGVNHKFCLCSAVNSVWPASQFNSDGLNQVYLSEQWKSERQFIVLQWFHLVKIIAGYYEERSEVMSLTCRSELQNCIITDSDVFLWLRFHTIKLIVFSLSSLFDSKRFTNENKRVFYLCLTWERNILTGQIQCFISTLKTIYHAFSTVTTNNRHTKTTVIQTVQRTCLLHFYYKKISVNVYKDRIILRINQNINRVSLVYL